MALAQKPRKSADLSTVYDQDGNQIEVGILRFTLEFKYVCVNVGHANLTTNYVSPPSLPEEGQEFHQVPSTEFHHSNGSFLTTLHTQGTLTILNLVLVLVCL